jgi:hypothetical protein
MQLQERARELGNDAKQRMREAKFDKADRERQRLRTENQLMRERIERTDGELSLALETLDDMVKTDGRAERAPSRHRIRRLFVLGAAAGSAYLMGAKAGRERYESFRRWWAGMRRRASTSSMDDPSVRVTAAVTSPRSREDPTGLNG